MAITGDHAPSVSGSVIMLTALAFISFFLRIYCRVSRRSWATEDWIMTAAVVPFIALAVGCIGGSFNGIGIHVSRLSQPGNEKYQANGQKFFLIFEVGYCAAIIPIKLSISWMLIRVAEGRKVYIYIQYATIAVFTVMNVIALIFILTNCIPTEAMWDTSIIEKGEGSCKPAHVLTDVYYATTAVNIMTDWITALMPIPLLWNVQLDRNSKAAVIGLMSLGILASLSACIRLKYTINLTNQTDFLYAVANVVIWGFAENAIGMFVGNIATLRPLFRKFFNSTLRRTGYSSRSRPSRLASNYELSQHGPSKSHDGYMSSTVTEVKGNHQGRRGRRDSQLSDDSQKLIFDGRGPGAGGAGIGAGTQRTDIMVSRHVNVTYEQ
ncbi:hypothetical protein ASPVEDRAFT_77940 [Aspergillus versicolor CBS 583.65]|uniref:Rhodopsin domain-containing protein n=1 Tax=Aspergillus versicolor CBS 583.65 TaxID=1036611 RepID=A0A1L9P3R8_ASPVE|nr:uncharacterized protein ASPVEDRAFT_77940 [Aspergillus versicolor CBS 583.65]OJI96161.1 hypothetical protein ASPVEDRAFT_77940 [Aspergillus versicolor CBS 583.65]